MDDNEIQGKMNALLKRRYIIFIELICCHCITGFCFDCFSVGFCFDWLLLSGFIAKSLLIAMTSILCAAFAFSLESIRVTVCSSLPPHLQTKIVWNQVNYKNFCFFFSCNLRIEKNRWYFMRFFFWFFICWCRFWICSFFHNSNVFDWLFW